MDSQATLYLQTGIRFVDSDIRQFETATATAENWHAVQNKINNTENNILSHEYGLSEASLNFYANQNSEQKDTLDIVIKRENYQRQQERVDNFKNSLSTIQREITIGLEDDKTEVEIAQSLGCSKQNVGYHVNQIQKKSKEFFD